MDRRHADVLAAAAPVDPPLRLPASWEATEQLLSAVRVKQEDDTGPTGDGDAWRTQLQLGKGGMVHVTARMLADPLGAPAASPWAPAAAAPATPLPELVVAASAQGVSHREAAAQDTLWEAAALVQVSLPRTHDPRCESLAHA
jgi:hypothetical protein